jgi:hypothetical protein
MSHNTMATVIGREYNDKDKEFDENFYKMNTEQMIQDVNNFESQEFESNFYSNFSNSAERPCKFDYVSMLDGPNKTAHVNINESKVIFFKQYCYKILRRGICGSEHCAYSHEV